MRIISGSLGGRKIMPPKQMPNTRPTTDLAKESLFNILQSRFTIDGAKTLDLFGGTGCISYELASRGANNLTIIEKDKTMVAFIEKNMALLQIKNATVLRADVFSFLATCQEQYDLIFAGPPYMLDTIDTLPKIITTKKMLQQNGYFILEHTPRNNYENLEGFVLKRNYGTTFFSFFQ